VDHPYEYDLLCIGGGAAARAAALVAAEHGKRVAVVEKERSASRLGMFGGTVPSKTLREAVRAFKAAQRADPIAAEGPVPPPDLELLRERVAVVCDDHAAATLDEFARLGVDLISAKAHFRDAHTIAIESVHGVREVTAAHVLIATGTHSVEPAGVTCDGEVLVDAESLLDIPHLPRSLVVVGCGLVGLEYGSMFAALGVEVTMVDGRTHPLDFLDDSIFDELVAEVSKRHVTVRFGRAVAGANVETGEFGRKAVVRLSDGSRVAADVALFATERHGSTESIGLDAIGLDVGARGHVRVDADFRTSVRNVFAAGDVIGGTPRASIAAEQGRIAACRMFGIATPPLAEIEVLGVYSVPELASVGATEQRLRAAEIPYAVGVARYKEIARGAMLGDEFGFFKMLFDRRDRRLLGVHCAGTHATELIHVAHAVMALGGDLDYFLTTVFNYPTLAECYKVAALNAANQFSVVAGR
jgi:NAD(P) transhydrogenase